MANITLLGASYTDVPAVTGGILHGCPRRNASTDWGRDGNIL